ncbi:hypothetical protein KFU94_43410 [Chloroflexi bacterium TSY]|nr:hypothetical protein [Chloroflexi bacterium TSY]
MAKSTTTRVTTRAIEFYDSWHPRQELLWRKSAILVHRGTGKAVDFEATLKHNLADVKTRMTEDDLLRFWHGPQVSATLIALSLDRESAYKSVPQLQPICKSSPRAQYLYAVFLGPKQGAFKVETYRVQPAENSLGVIPQYVPITR